MNATNPVTMMFTDRVKPEKVSEYNIWLSGIHGDTNTFAGFKSPDVIRPQDPSIPEYIVLIKFDCQENMSNWLYPKLKH